MYQIRQTLVNKSLNRLSQKQINEQNKIYIKGVQTAVRQVARINSFTAGEPLFPLAFF